MSGTERRRPRWMETAFASLLLLSYFLPWMHSLGTPVAAHEIRERLAGPHRLVSVFDSGSRISLDYSLARGLPAIPTCALLVLVMVLLGKYRPWAGILTGAVAVAAFVFLKSEVAGFPFHSLAAGAYMALAAGAGLALSPLVRLFSRG